MPNSAHTGKVAQLILSLTTTPDRAASTVGDLLEETDTRGSLWFWSNVVGTACSLCWRDFSSAPLRIIWLGFRGWIAAFFWTNLPLMPIELLVMRPNPNPLMNPFWVWPLVIAAEIFGALIAGWRIGKCSKGRELAAAFSATFAIAASYMLVGYLAGWRLRRYGHPLDALAEDCLEAFFVILGAALFRFSTKTETVGGIIQLRIF